MAVGTYGITRPSDVALTDIDMFYTYSPDRETISDEVFRLDATQLLSYNTLPEDDQIEGNENILEGLYNLTLPANIFNQIGIYTIYLRPKVEVTTIIDCSVLSSLPTVKGIVLEANSLPEKLRANNAMQGYKIEYIDDNGGKIRNVTRYVVTSNKVVPVAQNVGTTSQRAIRYRFDDSGTLIFLQLTPSSSSDLKPNVKPFIGNAGQTILISNTNFNPVMIEVDLVENTIESLTNYIAGEQIKDVDNGILTYYDKDRNIIKQFDLYEIKDDVTNVSLYDVKEERDNIDESQNFDDITEDVQ
jgi:hypothetical protein